jgi:hypothetical protein
MTGKGIASWTLAGCLLASVSVVFADSRSQVLDATLTLRFMPGHLEQTGIRIETTDRVPHALAGEVEFLLDDAAEVMLTESVDGKDFAKPSIQIVPGIRIVTPTGTAEVFEFVWANDRSAEDAASLAQVQTSGSRPVLELRGYRVGQANGIVAAAESIRISPALAHRLGDPRLADVSLGHAFLNGVDSDRIGEEGSMAPVEMNQPMNTSDPDGGVAAPGPDMTFCQLYGLQQFGRLGDIVGLSVATTSWNIGARDMIWMANPDPRHPMIVWNVYRLKNDRFEQIGMSHVKHGFFALGDAQCGGQCTFEPGHGPGDWLGQNCTDTYTSSLNASQGGLGPRYEINPWTGGFTYAGSHMSSSHSHNGIQHRCQVRDSDLVTAQNFGAQYFTEGQYITIDDTNPVNSIGYKPVTPNGAAGGTWTFSMSGSGTLPITGPAIHAWTGATFTTLAQEVPVVRFSSPDGRCILGAKAIDLGGGLFRYEYALYNIDMHRKAGSFHVPIPSGATVSNAGFSGVRHHDEPYVNSIWAHAINGNGITWSTSDNPIRWGMMYNFWFEADVPPGDVEVTVGLYDPGTPNSISGTTVGPFLVNPAPDLMADPSGMQKSRFISTMVPQATTAAGGTPTAIRVTLTNLHDVNPPYTGGPGADYSSFEGQVRWVGPPQEYTESAIDQTAFHAATLQCSPFYQDWSTVGLLHVTGSEILPSSVYTLENVAVSCQGNEENCSDVSAALEVATTRWADVIDPYSPPSPTVQPDLADVSALVDKFRGAPGAPLKVQALLSGNVPDLIGDVDFTQISSAVDAFRGLPYPNAGPVACP